MPIVLTEILSKRHAPSLMRVIMPFTERRAALRKLISMSVVLAWVWYWDSTPSAPVYVQQADQLLPVAIGLFGVSLVWTIYVWFQPYAIGAAMNIVGTILSLGGLTLMFAIGFDLMVPFVILFPLATITIGGRYPAPWFWASVVYSLTIVIITAPAGYFGVRPIVLGLAVMICVGLPLVVAHILNGLRAVSVEAVHAMEAQSRFVAMLSHELRTPLNSILGAINLIDGDKLDRGTRELVQLMRPNAALLMTRVEDVLDVGAIEAGTFRLDQRPFDIRTTIAEVRAIIDVMAHERGIRLEVDVDADVPPALMGDPKRIAQVIGNLASNAVKYTPAGGLVRITVDQRHHAPTECDLTITVSDTGVGIPPGKQAVIFDAFQQAQQGNRQLQAEGVGLGLFIARTISEQMTGALACRSQDKGPGTVFTWEVTLPVSDTPDIPRPLDFLTLAKLHRETATRRRCLVVDDGLSNRQIMQKLLSASGQDVVLAPNGRVALDLLDRETFDIVFLDLLMPEVSGWDVLEALHSKPPGVPHPPVVIISAAIDGDDEERAKALGVFEFLRKPLSPERVLEILVALEHTEPVAKPTVPTGASSNYLEAMARCLSPAQMGVWLNALDTDVLGAMANIKKSAPGPQRRQAIHQLKNVLLTTGCGTQGTLWLEALSAAELESTISPALMADLECCVDAARQVIERARDKAGPAP